MHGFWLCVCMGMRVHAADRWTWIALPLLLPRLLSADPTLEHRKRAASQRLGQQSQAPSPARPARAQTLRLASRATAGASRWTRRLTKSGMSRRAGAHRLVGSGMELLVFRACGQHRLGFFIPFMICQHCGRCSQLHSAGAHAVYNGVAICTEGI